MAMKEIDKKLKDTIHRYSGSGIEQQVDYDKFYLYSLITALHSHRGFYRYRGGKPTSV